MFILVLAPKQLRELITSLYRTDLTTEVSRRHNHISVESVQGIELRGFVTPFLVRLTCCVRRMQ